MEKVNEFKPQWKDAPDWARFLVCDVFFGWYWHEKEPSFNENETYTSSGGYKRATPNGGHYLRHMELRP